MKTSYKIIILIGVIASAIAIIILSSVLPHKVQNSNSKNNTNSVKSANNTNTIVDENNNYVNISYETTSEVFKIDGTDKTITVYQEFPIVYSSNESVKNKIQANLGKVASDEFESYKKQVKSRLVDIDASFMENVGNLELKWSFSNDRNDSKVVSVKNVSSGSLGGVAWTNKRGYSYSSETGERLKIEDIAINPEALRKYVNETIIKYLRSNYQQLGIYQESLNNLSGIVNIDNLTWYLSSSGLTVCFDEHSISPDSIEYTIDYTKLEDLVKDEYLK